MMNNNNLSDIKNMVNFLQQGQVIAYPTEAVFGLGCDPDNQTAVQHLLALKNRPWQKGLILVAADYQQLHDYIDSDRLDQQQLERVFSSWPGPVTWVMPVKKQVSRWLTGEFDSLAVRVSAHQIVQELCERFGKPIVSTSANLSGMPPCRTYEQVKQQFGVDFPVLNAETGGRENPSEIRNVLTGQLIRQG